MTSMRLPRKRSKGKQTEPDVEWVVLEFTDCHSIGISPGDKLTAIKDDVCRILWDDGKLYDAKVLFKGSKTDCLKKENEELQRVFGDEDVQAEAPKSKRKRKLIKDKENSEKTKEKTKGKKGEKKKKKRADKAKSEFIIHISGSPPISPRSAMKDATNDATTGTHVANKDDYFGIKDSMTITPWMTAKLDNGDTIENLQQSEDPAEHVVVDGRSHEEDGHNSIRLSSDLSSSDLSSSDLSEEEEDPSSKVTFKNINVIPDDGPPQRGLSPVHNSDILFEDKLSRQLDGMRSAIQGMNNQQDNFVMQLDDMRSAINRMNDEQEFRFDNIRNRLEEIERLVNLLFTSGIANSLVKNSSQTYKRTTPNLTPATQIYPPSTRPITQKITPPTHVTPQLRMNITPQSLAILDEPQHSQNITPVTPQIAKSRENITPQSQASLREPPPNQPSIQSSEQPKDKELPITELISSADLVPIIMKHKTRRSLACGLVEELVDLDTWLNSCVNGSKDKPALDADIIEYVKKKVFEIHELKVAKDLDYETAYLTAWGECIKSIDSRARDLKRRLKEKKSRKSS